MRDVNITVDDQIRQELDPWHMQVHVAHGGSKAGPVSQAANENEICIK